MWKKNKPRRSVKTVETGGAESRRQPAVASALFSALAVAQ
jgi:hypothetical protein